MFHLGAQLLHLACGVGVTLVTWGSPPDLGGFVLQIGLCGLKLLHSTDFLEDCLHLCLSQGKVSASVQGVIVWDTEELSASRRDGCLLGTSYFH